MDIEGREESGNVDDRRGMGGTGVAVGGVGGFILLLVALYFGVDPRQLANLVGNPNQQQPGQQRPADPAEEKLAHFTKVVFRDTEIVWEDLFKKMGREYAKPTLVLFEGQVNSACGQADAAVGPFYCGGDHNVYIDLSFYRDMERKLNAPGEFARAYVVAHEVGHHVQRLLGYSKKGIQGETENQHSVRLELQADYFAGVWAHYAQKYESLNENDIKTALHAAFEIGDDRLQRKARGTVVPDSFTHGTSKQRMRWFMAGFKTGSVKGADQLFTLPYDEL
jgi:predicted metalloprotease